MSRKILWYLPAIIILLVTAGIIFNASEPQSDAKPEIDTDKQTEALIYPLMPVDQSLIPKLTQYRECLKMIRYVDERIRLLDIHNERFGMQSGTKHEDRARYLEVRVHLLYLISNMGYELEAEKNIDGQSEFKK